MKKDLVFEIEKMISSKKNEIEQKFNEINLSIKIIRDGYPFTNNELNKIHYNELINNKEKLSILHDTLQNITLEIARIKGY